MQEALRFFSKLIHTFEKRYCSKNAHMNYLCSDLSIVNMTMSNVDWKKWKSIPSEI